MTISSSTYEPVLVALNATLRRLGGNSKMNQIFETIHATHEVSRSNFLIWKNQFINHTTYYINGITINDLTHSVTWGLDPWGRVFIVLQYAYKKKTEKTYRDCQSLALFQKNSYQGNQVARGGFFKKLNLNPNDKDFLSIFYKLLTTNHLHGEKHTFSLINQTQASQLRCRDTDLGTAKYFFFLLRLCAIFNRRLFSNQNENQERETDSRLDFKEDKNLQP